MEHYPADYVTQQAPLVVVQGLGAHTNVSVGHKREPKVNEVVGKEDNRDDDSSHPLIESVEKIQRVLPEVHTDCGEKLVTLFKRHDVANDIWASQYTKSNFNSNTLAYKFSFVGNDFGLIKTATLEDKKKKSNIVSYTMKDVSILSPFNKSSSIYPYGILDENWLAKYKHLIPAVFISFHKLDTTEDYDIKDVGLAKEITTIKNQIQKAGIRFIEIVVSDQSAVENPSLTDRINNIRNMTGLAPRTGLLFLPESSHKEYNVFVEAILHLIRPWCYDFYINLEKKLRRKRVNPPSNLSKTLCFDSNPQDNTITYSIDQWDARYAVKLALVNLFHQNNEMSIKHLESAYESLILLLRSLPLAEYSGNKEVVFLWHQSRQLLDILTINIVKEYLYLELSNKAYRRFDTHIQNIVSILKLNNINPASYSTCHWLSILFEWLGELCVMADEYIVPIDRPLLSDSNFGALAMPQPGYIFLQAVNFIRRTKARTEAEALENGLCVSPNEKLILQEEDAKEVKQLVNVKTNIVVKTELDIIDYYLSLPLEKNLDYPFHQKSIVVLQKSLVSFMKAKETEFERSIAYINFQLAEENYALKNYEKAVEFYEECLIYYKQDNWKTILILVFVKLVNCFLKLKKYSGAILYILELAVIDDVFFSSEIKSLIFPENKKATLLNLVKFQSKDEIPVINLYPADETILPPNLFAGVFLFKTPLLPLSQRCEMQFSLQSLVNKHFINDFAIESVTIEFKGYFLAIKLEHDASKPDSQVQVVDFPQDESVAAVNLNLGPSAFKVFHFSQMANKIDTNTVTSIVINISHEKFGLKYHLPVVPLLANDSYIDAKNNPAVVTPNSSDAAKYYINNVPKTSFFWVSANGMSKQLVKTPNPYEVVVIPRRPETSIQVVEPTNAYSNELYELKLLVDNKDHEDIGLIFRPSVNIYDAKATSSHGTRPSSKVSSRVTSPRNSLDLRRPLASGDASFSDSNHGVPLTELKWDDLDMSNKSQPHDLKLVSVKSHSKESHSLFIKIPNVSSKYFVIKIECSFFTGEEIAKQQESEEVKKTLSTRDTLNIRIPIVAPFGYSFGVLPKLRFEDVPNPFLFDDKNAQNNGPLTVHSRTWSGKALITFLGNSSVDIVDTLVEVYTPVPEQFDCQILGKKKNPEDTVLTLSRTGSTYTLEKLFSTIKKDIQVHANIAVHVKIVLKWRRHDLKTVNQFESQVWKLALPLFEPRVLFEVSRLHKEEEKNICFVFKYVIENPTARIFTFSTLIDSNENFDIHGNNKSIGLLPILPFTRQQLKFKAVVKQKAQGKLKIPALRVYDLFYKVTLPVLLATNEALANKSDIYIKI